MQIISFSINIALDVISFMADVFLKATRLGMWWNAANLQFEGKQVKLRLNYCSPNSVHLWPIVIELYETLQYMPLTFFSQIEEML